MNKYLVSAALAAVIGAAAFTAPASAQVGFSVGVGGDRPYYGDGYHHPRHYNSGPGVRVYAGRSSASECYTEKKTVYRNGKKTVIKKEICN